MRLFFVLMFAVFLVPSIVQASNSDQPTDPEPSSFEEAYAGYKQYEFPENYDEKHLKTHYAEKAYKFGLEKFGPEHNNTVNLAINWVFAYGEHPRGHVAPGKAFDATIKLYEQANQEAPVNIIDAYNVMAKSLMSSKPRKAVKYYKQSIRVIDQHFGENSLEMAGMQLEIGKRIYNSYSGLKALPYLKKALEIYSSNPQAKEISIAVTQFWLGKYYLSREQNKKATSSMQTSLEIFDEKAPSHQYTLTGHAFMVEILERQGKSDEATYHCQAIGRLTPNDPDREYLPVYKKQPEYPRRAQEMGKSGYALVEFTVDKEGFVRNPVVIESTSKGMFDLNSIKAVSKFRYAPRFVNGEPVDTEGVRNLITYEMSDR